MGVCALRFRPLRRFLEGRKEPPLDPNLSGSAPLEMGWEYRHMAHELPGLLPTRLWWFRWMVTS